MSFESRILLFENKDSALIWLTSYEYNLFLFFHFKHSLFILTKSA